MRGMRWTEKEYEEVLKLKTKVAAPKSIRKTALPRRSNSYLEELLEDQLRDAGMRSYIREHRFAYPRRWRIDFAFPKLAVEVQGAPHRIKARFDAEHEKIQALTFRGWHYLPLSSADVRKFRAVSIIKTALLAIHGPPPEPSYTLHMFGGGGGGGSGGTRTTPIAFGIGFGEKPKYEPS